MKVGRNDPCPCGRMEKYKRCCSGKVPWPDLFRRNDPSIPLHMTARGKNLAFLGLIANALQIDVSDRRLRWIDVKRACTADAVRMIHEAIPSVWPSQDDLRRVL